MRRKVLRASAGDRSGARALVLFTVRLPPKQSRFDQLGKSWKPPQHRALESAVSSQDVLSSAQ